MRTRSWRCWVGWHAYVPWETTFQQRLTFTEYDTGIVHPWAETTDQKRHCALCGKIQWRVQTKTIQGGDS